MKREDFARHNLQLVEISLAVVKLYKSESLPVRERGKVRIRRLLPETIAGLEIDRMELPSRAYMAYSVVAFAPVAE